MVPHMPISQTAGDRPSPSGSVGCLFTETGLLGCLFTRWFTALLTNAASGEKPGSRRHQNVQVGTRRCRRRRHHYDYNVRNNQDRDGHLVRHQSHKWHDGCYTQLQRRLPVGCAKPQWAGHTVYDGRLLGSIPRSPPLLVRHGDRATPACCEAAAAAYGQGGRALSLD
jgi:hypothetical protein